MSSNFVKSIVMPDGTKLSLSGVPTGGTTGQVLAKASDVDGDVEWITGGGASGDFVTRSEFDSTVGDIQEALDQIINGVIE